MSNPTKSLPSLKSVMKFLESNISDSNRSEFEHTIKSKLLTRQSFFDEAYWAILVSHMSYEVAKVWQEKAASTRFPNDWSVLADWDTSLFNKWCKAMAKKLKNPKKDLEGKFRDRWWAIWDIACWLTEFTSENDFRRRVFNGKKSGAELNDDDIRRLIKFKNTGRLFLIGEANRFFILRNLGGNFLKPDIWVKKFCEWYGSISVSKLAGLLKKNGISCGKFDLYLWWYCSYKIRESHLLGSRFDDAFGKDNEPKTSLTTDSISVATLESSIWDCEGIRVIVRAPTNAPILSSYSYTRSAKDSWTLSQFINKRIEPILDRYEISIVDGKGLIPHRKTLLSTVRTSYRT